MRSRSTSSMISVHFRERSASRRSCARSTRLSSMSGVPSARRRGAIATVCGIRSYPRLRQADHTRVYSRQARPLEASNKSSQSATSCADLSPRPKPRCRGLRRWRPRCRADGQRDGALDCRVSPMSTPRKVVVVGAGIGGLTAALALLERGIDVEVYEQSSELKEVGAGIQISSNGTRVLFALGLEAALARVQVRPERRELRHWSTGETWNWFDLGDKNVERFGTPHLMLHRADLHDLLAGAVRAKKRDAITLNKRCVTVASQARHADATFADDSTVRAAYVIGADGIHSTVRVCLFGPSKPIFTGCIAWRGLIPMGKLPSRLARMVGTNWLGPRGNVLHYPVRRGEIMNFVSTSEREDWKIESWATVGTNAELRNDFRDWHPDVQVMIDQDRDALQMGLDHPRADAGLVEGPRHVARRCLPSDAAVPGPGRRDGDRGRLCPRGLSR